MLESVPALSNAAVAPAVECGGFGGRMLLWLWRSNAAVALAVECCCGSGGTEGWTNFTETLFVPQGASILVCNNFLVA